MKRLTIFLTFVLAFCGIGLTASSAMAIDGPLANASVSFGQWETDPPFDRFPNNSDRFRNNHQLIPGTVTIKSGGAVNFIISGLHQPIIYDNGTQPDDVVETLTTTAAGGQVLIDDPNDRIYRGLDPSITGRERDRVEVVLFSKPGTYLVICGVQGHFVNDDMFGFVKVLPGK
jgi:hypothetical protein